MNLMISETALRPTLAATDADVSAVMLTYATGECPLGPLLIARSVKGVCAIPIGASNDELEADLATRFPLAHPR